LRFQNSERGRALTPALGHDYLVARLGEKSTYSHPGPALAGGVSVDPEQFSAIAAALMALVGVFEVFRREKK
jgi:hypothetical protein